MILGRKKEKYPEINKIIRQFKNESTYEGTLSYATVGIKERKHTYMVKISHYRSSLAYGYDSDRYNQRKKNDIKRAKDNFEKNLEELGFNYKMMDLNTYKVKKEKNKRFK